MLAVPSKCLMCGVLAGALWPISQPQPIFRTSADVVRVEASVLDRNRRPVRGLRAEDVVVLENGAERPVVAFAPVELPPAAAPATATAAWVQDAPRDVVSNGGADAGRLVVIAFDWSIRFYDQALARRIALAAVDGLGPTDEATVLFTKPVETAGRPQGFTADHARLRAAINQPFAVALTDPHPDRSKRIIDPEGYGSGECLCGLCTLDSLPALAEMTGGRTVTNTEAPEAQVASILDESSSYYVLGFTPSMSARRDATRRIEVRARAAGLTVKARNQYNVAEQTPVTGRPEAILTRAVSDVLPVRNVPLEMSAVPMIAGSRLAAVLVGRLGAGVARPTAMLSTALTPRAVPVVSRRLAIKPSASGREGPAPLGLVSVLALEPGSYEIRVATELAGGAAGSVHTFIDVPDFRRAPLSLSGVLLHVAPEEPVASRDEIDGALPFVPTARRAFASGEQDRECPVVAASSRAAGGSVSPDPGKQQPASGGQNAC